MQCDSRSAIENLPIYEAFGNIEVFGRTIRRLHMTQVGENAGFE